MGKQKPKKSFSSFSSYIYLINYLLVFSVITLRILDIYYTIILLEDGRVTETIPLSQFILTFGPVASYLISTLPIAAFFLVNYYIRENVYYLLGLSVVLIIFIFYMVPIVQNSLNVFEQL